VNQVQRDRRRLIVPWPRGIRGRLVAVYLLAAVVLGAAGVAMFTVALQHGLRANVDTGLRARATTTAAELGASVVSENLDPAPSIGAAGARITDQQSITAVFNPSGRLVDAQPVQLPASPLTSEQQRHAPAGPTYRTADYAGDPFRFLAVPLQRPDGIWVIVVGESLGAANDAASQVNRALFIAVPVLLGLVGAGAWFLSGAALKPVDRLRADAQDLGEHNPAGRITEPATKDSLNQLARTFNALLDRLHTSLDRQRTLVADAGHGLRTPLAVLQTELETAVRPTRSRADLVDSIDNARQEVMRLASLAEDLLLLAEADGGRPIVRRQLTDISELIDDLARTYSSRADEQNITLRFDRSDILIADVDPVAIRRILDNLIANALRHTPPQGTIVVTADQVPVSVAMRDTHFAGSAVLHLRVADTGPGFPPDFLPHACDRFGRADQSRSRSATASGSGLGLAIVAALAAAHAGTARAANQPGGGALLDVELLVELR
jgi:two-component system OmpR family sensor kinase